MNATPADQRRLLDLADLDARIAADRRLHDHPPQAERVRELTAQRLEQSQELSARLGARDDLAAQLARVESDVAVVDARAARDAERLAVATTASHAQGFEHELASLGRRKAELEDAQLELMERLEDAESALQAQQTLIAVTVEEGTRLSVEGKAVVNEAQTRLDAAGRDRAAIAAALPAPLFGLYERIAARGAGAALLQQQTCGACRMVLAGTEFAAIRQAADDEVLTCPECGAILVRTAESGV